MATSTWKIGNSGEWNVAVDWNPATVPNDIGSTAIINAATNTVTIGGGVTFAIGSLSMLAGGLQVLGGLTTSEFTQPGGVVNIAAGKVLPISGAATFGTGAMAQGGAELDGAGTLSTGGTTSILQSARAISQNSPPNRW